LAKLFGYDDGTGDNKDFEGPVGIPGFGAVINSASDIGKANGNGQGLGKIPPGLYIAFNDKPDDFFENHYEAEVDDVWKVNFDGTNRGNSEGKGMFGAWAGKSGDDPSGKANAKGNQGGGNPNCTNEGVTDNDPIKISGQVGVPYVVEDFTAVGSSCKVADPSQIQIQVTTPPPMPFVKNLNQGESFIPTTAETYTITASFQGQFETREVIVTASLPTFEVRSGTPPTNYITDFTTNIDLSASGNNNYNLGTIQSIDCGVFICTKDVTIDLLLTDGADPPGIGTYTTTYRVFDDDSPVKSTTITETIEVIQS